jgi:hypothetical protein
VGLSCEPEIGFISMDSNLSEVFVPCYLTEVVGIHQTKGL